MAASSSPSHIIRVPRTDEEGSFVLGEITPSGTSKPLNLKFVATEGEEPYVVKLRHDRIGDLRATNSPCSPDEWESILKSLLIKGEPVEGIEAGAEATLKKSIVITIRRRVAGINQRLGAITLNHKADEAIQLYDWCGAVAVEREQLKEKVIAETAKVSDLESRITALRAELEELTQSKKEREIELLEKFCHVLNEKKVKIREQQKLLNSAHGDSSGLATSRVAQLSMNSSQEERKPVVASAPRRNGKRKAPARDAESDSEDGFEKADDAADEMDVDEQPAPPREVSPQAVRDEDDSRQTTDDDATGSEPDEDEEVESAPVSPPPARKPEPKGQKAHTGASKAKDKDVAVHPPRRNLRNANPGKSTPPPADGSGSETDDEL